jgi:hypothetical protein
MLAYHVPGYKNHGIAPPYGNYGQLATNDAELPKLLLTHLNHNFPLVFVQDHPAPARYGQGTTTPIRRYTIRGDRDLAAALNPAGSP